MAEKTTPPRGMVSAPSCGPEDVYAGHPISLGLPAIFRRKPRVAILLLVVG
jgi:hypothetical protein